MAEKSFPWTNNGTGDGTSGGYTALEWGELWRAMLLAGEEDVAGVFRGHRNSLAVTGTASPLSVDTGAACVHGKLYINTSSLSLSVATPVVGTTGGHVVLELDWVAQTVRAKAYRNTDGVSTPPSLTQSLSTVWQIRLATFSITTGGVITVTDARRWVPFTKGTAGRVPYFDADGVIADDAGLTYNATTDRLTVGSLSSVGSLTNGGPLTNAGSLTNGGSLTNAGSLSTGAPLSIAVTNAETDTNAAEYMRLNVAGGLVARLYRDYNGSSNYLGLESFNVGNSAKTPVVLQEFGGDIGIGTTSPTATLDVSGSARVSSNLSVGNNLTATGNLAVTGDMTRGGAPVPNLYRRQGGSASAWATAGNSNHIPGQTRMQAGVTSVSVTGASGNGSTAITFPVAFSNTPIVLVSIVSSSPSTPIATVRAPSVAASGFTAQIRQESGGGDNTYTVSWLAIGPE